MREIVPLFRSSFLLTKLAHYLGDQILRLINNKMFLVTLESFR